MTNLSKILNTVLLAILAITAVITGLFYFGGEVEGQALLTPVYTATFVNWSFVLLIATAVIAIIFEIVKLVINPKNAIRTLISIGVMVVIVVIAFSLGDATPLHLPGYEGADNVPSMLLMADTFLYTTYFLFGIAIIAILYTELSRLFR